MTTIDDRIILECFISPGEYVFLNDCCCTIQYYKNEIVEVEFETEIELFETGNSICLHQYASTLSFIEDSADSHLPDFINNLLPNMRKLTTEELMIKDIIT